MSAGRRRGKVPWVKLIAKILQRVLIVNPFAFLVFPWHTERKMRRMKQAGMTLLEILMVTTLLAVLLVIVLLMWKNQTDRAGDAKRKADLARLKVAFEDYYNDKSCYPASGIVDDPAHCGGNQMDPYLSSIPCDPATKLPYKYVPPDGDSCKGYVACAALANKEDPDIERIGCDPTAGCGWGEGYNYCIASGVSPVAVGFSPNSTPTPVPPGGPTPTLSLGFNGNYACRPGLVFGGVIVFPSMCNNVGDPVVFDCPTSFFESNCQGLCGNQAYWCAR